MGVVAFVLVAIKLAEKLDTKAAAAEGAAVKLKETDKFGDEMCAWLAETDEVGDGPD